MTAFKNPRPLILEDIKSITEEMLIELDEKNRTWLHDAACNDYLQEIPKKFLTSERLNKKTS